MDAVHRLEARARELRSSAREIARKQAGLKRKAKVAQGLAPATPWMRSVALRVLALAESDVEVAQQYIRWKGRHVQQDEVRAWDADLSADDRRHLLCPPVHQSCAARQLAEARKFFAERDVVAWVRRQNVDRGVAPTPGAIIDEFAQRAGPSGRRSSRHKWLRRVTGRWGGRKCIFAVGDQLSKETFDRKAELAAECVSDQDLGSETWAALRPRIRDGPLRG